jgi:hypothetical protein
VSGGAPPTKQKPPGEPSEGRSRGRYGQPGSGAKNSPAARAGLGWESQHTHLASRPRRIWGYLPRAPPSHSLGRIPTDLCNRRAGMVCQTPVPGCCTRLELHRRNIGTGDNKIALDAAHGEGGHRASLTQRKKPRRSGAKVLTMAKLISRPRRFWDIVYVAQAAEEPRRWRLARPPLAFAISRKSRRSLLVVAVRAHVSNDAAIARNSSALNCFIISAPISAASRQRRARSWQMHWKWSSAWTIAGKHRAAARQPSIAAIHRCE